MKTIFKSIYAKILLTILGIYSLLGFVILPYLIQSNFSSIIKKELNTHAYLSRVYINPFTFEVGLHNLLIQDDKDSLLLYFESLKTNLTITSLLSDEIELDYLNIQSLQTSVTLYENKELNFSHILKQLSQKPVEKSNNTESETSSKPLFFTLNKLSLLETRLKYTDETKSRVFDLETKPFSFEITNFSTKPNSIAKINTNIEIIDTLNVELNSNLLLTPTQIDGTFALKDIKLIKIHQYLEDDLKFKFQGLVQDISSSFNINIEENSVQTQIKNLNINIPNINYNDNKVNIHTSNIHHSIKDLNITNEKSLSYDISNIKLTANETKFTDLIKDKNHQFSFRNLNILVDQFSSKKEDTSKVSLSLQTPKSGAIDININLIQEPLTVEAIATIKKLDLVPYKDYVKDFINIDIKNTFLDVHSKLLITNTKQNIDANINISKIDIFHDISKVRLLKLNTFDIKGLKYTNNNLFIENVHLDDFKTSFKIDANQKTTIDGLVVEQKKKKSSSKNDKKTAFNYYIKNLKLSNGRAEFSDHSLPLNFDTNIHSLSANINDLSSKNDEASVKLKGVIEKYGVANIQAKTIVSNFKNKTDVKIDFENLDVRSFSPYSGKFIGQKIADGRLWLALNYSIRNAQLSSTNNIKIKNLTLGDDVESKDALSLPVGLAIALLEDGEGLIDLDVPVKGDMDQPQFELSGVIWKTLGNVITNIVTAPFRFLGSLLGIDSDELGVITFNFSEAVILPPQKEKLDKLIQVFQKKKNLVIVLQPTFNKMNDSNILRDKKFAKLIKSQNRNKTIQTVYLKKFGQKKFEEVKNKYKKSELITILSNEIRETIKISSLELETLAITRANNIKTYFLSNKLRLDRIQIKNDVFENKDNDTKELSLKLELNIKDKK